MNKTTRKLDLSKDIVQHYGVDVYSLDGQAFRITASDVAEPPLKQSKACY